MFKPGPGIICTCARVISFGSRVPEKAIAFSTSPNTNVFLVNSCPLQEDGRNRSLGRRSETQSPGVHSINHSALHCLLKMTQATPENTPYLWHFLNQQRLTFVTLITPTRLLPLFACAREVDQPRPGESLMARSSIY